MKNHATPLVPESFLSDLSPEAFDELMEQFEMWLAACPEIHPYGSRLAELPEGWGLTGESETRQ